MFADRKIMVPQHRTDRSQNERFGGGGSGVALDTRTRAVVETGFGHDLGAVRVHADARAGATARTLHARAVTVGNDVLFAPGAYAPHTVEGQRLIGHEIAHVLQQSGTGPRPGPEQERDADAAAGAVARHERATVRTRSGIGSARQSDPEHGPTSRLVSQAAAYFSAANWDDRAALTRIIDWYLCTVSYEAFEEAVRRDGLGPAWTRLRVNAASVGRLSGRHPPIGPELRRMLRGPEPEEPEYWEPYRHDADRALPITVADETRLVQRDRAETIEGQGDQGNRIVRVPDNYWRMTAPALKAFLEHMTGGALTKFEKRLVANWNVLKPVPQFADSGVVGYYLRSGGSGNQEHTMYDTKGKAIVVWYSEQALENMGLGPINFVLAGPALARLAAQAGTKGLAWTTKVAATATRRLGQTATVRNIAVATTLRAARLGHATGKAMEGVEASGALSPIGAIGAALRSSAFRPTPALGVPRSAPAAGIRSTTSTRSGAATVPTTSPGPRSSPATAGTTAKPTRPMRAPVGGGHRGPVTATARTVTAHRTGRPAVEVLPRSSRPWDPEAAAAPDTPAPGRRRRASVAGYANDQLRRITSNPSNPLHPSQAPLGPVVAVAAENGSTTYAWRTTTFVTRKGKTLTGRYAGNQKGVVMQIGHAAAFASGAPERLTLEDADLNQVGGNTIESRGAFSVKPMVDIGDGVIVDLASLQHWEHLGVVPAGTVATARRVQ